MPDLPSLDDLGPDARLSEVDDMLTRAEKEGVLDRLPEDERSVKEAPITFARVATIRTRLYLLGYLDSPDGNRIDDALRRALRIFQGHAGLTVDGWVGNETWQALQELVSFETPFPVARWRVRNVQEAFRRAIRLRLHTLGFLPDRLAGSRDVSAALDAFKAFAPRLGFPSERVELDPDAAQVLFDQDALTARLAETDWDSSVGEPGDEAARETMSRFVRAVARVELWLLGYGTRPGDDTIYSENTAIGEPDANLGAALKAFRKDTARAAGGAGDGGRIDRAFFNRLESFHRAGEGTLSADALARIVMDAGGDLQSRIWSEVQSLGSRMWDGVKRAWNWLKSIVSRGIRFVRQAIGRGAQWVRNAARLLHAYALSSLEAVKLAFRFVREGLALFTRSSLPGSVPNVLEIRRDADLDLKVFVTPAARDTRVVTCGQDVLHRSEQFRAGARVVGALVRYLKVTIRSALGGWFGLILALVRTYGVMKRLHTVMDEEAALLAPG